MPESIPDLFKTANPKDLLSRALQAAAQTQQGHTRKNASGDATSPVYASFLAPAFLNSIDTYLEPFNKKIRKHFQTEKEALIKHFHYLKNKNEDAFQSMTVLSIAEEIDNDTLLDYKAPKDMREISKHRNVHRLQPATIHSARHDLQTLIDDSPQEQSNVKGTLNQHLIAILVGFLDDISEVRQEAVNHYRKLAEQYPGAGSPAFKAAGITALIIGIASAVSDMILGSNLGWTDPITLGVAAFAVLSLSLSIYFLITAKPKGLSRAALKLTNALQEKLPSNLANDVTHRTRGRSFIKTK